MTDLEKLKQLTTELQRLGSLYAVGRPEVSDESYDIMLEELCRLETKLGVQEPDSPNLAVWHTVSTDQVIPHKRPMLSLDNIIPTVDNDGGKELREWLESVYGTLEADVLEFTIEDKYDGMALSLRYEKNIPQNVLQHALLRGDGSAGEDVYKNAIKVKHIPITTGTQVEEIRGEVIMSFDTFRAINETLDKPYKTPRNAVAGMMRESNAKTELLEFMPYEAYAYDSDSPFSPNKGFEVSGTIEDVFAFIKSFKEAKDEERSKMRYPIDGIVIKLLNPTLRTELGIVSKSPRWAVAYKFIPAAALTTVIAIENQVSRLGTITPMVKIDPIFLEGVTISSINGDNYPLLMERGIGIGAKVFVARNGDVIPRISEVVEKSYDLVVPTRCPSCGSSVRLGPPSDGVKLRCVNPAGCPDQLKMLLVHHGSREAMNILGLGESASEALVNYGAVKHLKDLYEVSLKDIHAALNKASGKDCKTIASKLFNALHARKPVTLDKVLYSLGIPGLGRTVSKQLAETITLQDLLYRDQAWLTYILMSLDGVGDLTTQAIVNGMTYYGYATLGQWVDRDRIVIVNKPYVPTFVKERPGNPYVGKYICLSGSMEPHSKPHVADALTALGAIITSSVNKRTDILVAGPGSGSKSEDAKRLGKTIIAPDKLYKQIGI